MLNVLVDFFDLIEVLIYLMIGLEGIFGFIVDIIYYIVIEYVYKVFVLLVFVDIE